MAVGYSSFIATTTVKYEHCYFSCRWNFGKNFESSLYFYSYGCYSVSSLQGTTSCLEEGQLITSNLTITEPLENGQFNVWVDCNGQQKTLKSITVQSEKTIYI